MMRDARRHPREGERWDATTDQIVTIEGLAADGEHLHPLQRAFIAHDAFQCGHCTPGQLCSAAGMLREAAAGWPSAATADLTAERVTLDEAEIRERMSGNLCRCGVLFALTSTFLTGQTLHIDGGEPPT